MLRVLEIADGRRLPCQVVSETMVGTAANTAAASHAVFLHCTCNSNVLVLSKQSVQRFSTLCEHNYRLLEARYLFYGGQWQNQTLLCACILGEINISPEPPALHSPRRPHSLRCAVRGARERDLMNTSLTKYSCSITAGTTNLNKGKFLPKDHAKVSATINSWVEGRRGSRPRTCSPSDVAAPEVLL